MLKILAIAILVTTTVKTNIKVYHRVEVLKSNNVSDDIIVDFTYTSFPAAAVILFNNTTLVQDELVQQWTWDFGDGTQSNEKSPQHIYEEKKSYNVKLTLLLKKGESKTIIKSITYK